MSTQLDQIAKKAKSDRKVRFTSLAHLLTPEFLRETWRQMNRRGASGIDGETTKEFERDLNTRVQELCERLNALFVAAGSQQGPGFGNGIVLLLLRLVLPCGLLQAGDLVFRAERNGLPRGLVPPPGGRRDRRV